MAARGAVIAFPLLHVQIQEDGGHINQAQQEAADSDYDVLACSQALAGVDGRGLGLEGDFRYICKRTVVIDCFN